MLQKEFDALYKHLGLAVGASKDDIIKAHKAYRLKYHPDKNLNCSEKEKENITEKFIQAQDAYEKLISGLEHPESIQQEIPIINPVKPRPEKDFTFTPATTHTATHETPTNKTRERRPFWAVPEFPKIVRVPFYQDDIIDVAIMRERSNHLLSKYLNRTCYILSDCTLLFDETQINKAYLVHYMERLSKVNIDSKIQHEQHKKHWYSFLVPREKLKTSADEQQKPQIYIHIKNDIPEIYKKLNSHFSEFKLKVRLSV